MFLWSDVVARERERAQTVRDSTRAYSLKIAAQQGVARDRWQWRIMNTVGGWLVDAGCRLQMHVETTREVVTSSPTTLEPHPPCL